MLSKSQNKCWKSDYHLALLTMLSALRHGWGVLALCVEVFNSQPNHTRIAACNPKRATEQR
jgi:hypothetical protein